MPYRVSARTRAMAVVTAVCTAAALIEWATPPVSGAGTPFPTVPRSGSAVAGSPWQPPTPAASATGTSVTGTVATAKPGATAWTATPLSPSSAWSVDTQGGSFTYSVPMQAPSAAGPVPTVALAYDSGSVDGETGSTNNQPSPVGDGWTLAAGGYIDRAYLPCAQDGVQTGDLCWQSDNAVASFAGHSGRLVRDSASHKWKFQSDDGTVVNYLDPTSGGSRAGDYWQVITPDGIQYFFGRGAVTSGQPDPNSRWTVPVSGNNAGEPCYQAGNYAGSFCSQAWRWNLDYVLDRHGNAEALYYQTESNRYGQNNHASDVSYTRGGELAEIDYALRAGDEPSHGAARIVFAYTGRCLTSSCPTSGQAGFDATKWPDVPWAGDYCATGSACTSQPASPSFFSTQRLSSLHTEYGPIGSATSVDQWDLQHTFPDPNDGQNAALWLQQVTHTALARGPNPAITDPPIVFSGLPLANRLYGPTSLSGADALPLFFRFRISSVLTAAGATISINYDDPASTAGTIGGQACGIPSGQSQPRLPADPANNTELCFPQNWWQTSGSNSYPTVPVTDWFNKYIVTSIVADPGTGSTTARRSIVTTYNYGAPAWRLDRSPLIPANGRTYSVWAGFDQAQVVTGDGSDTAAQASVTKFFQGLNADPGKTSTPAKPVPNAAGGSVADDLWLAGRAWKQQTTLGTSGADVTATYTAPYASGVTADDGTYQARFVADGDAETVITLFNSAGSPTGTRTTETNTSYDSAFRPYLVSDLGDTATSSDDQCQTTSYASDAATNMLRYPAQVERDAVSCATTASVPNQVVSIQRYLYDNQPLGVLPGTSPVGNVTETDTLKGYSGSTPQWLVDTAAYDALGRATTTTQQRDGASRSTATSYTPAGAGLLTQTAVTSHNAVTDPSGWTTTTTLDPARGAPTSVTDANGHLTTASYDSLGRLADVWQPGNPQSGGNPPSTEYAYQLSQTATDYVATRTLGPNGTLTPWSYALYDGLLRQRQTQTAAEGGGRQITDILYTSTGQVSEHTNPYYTAGDPDGMLFEPANRQNVPSTTQYGLDGAGRVTDAKLFVINPTGQPSNITAWDTITSYAGDRVTVNPNYDSSHPTINGGIPTTTVYDARGRVISLTQYLSNNLATAATQTTSYGYDRWNNTASMTDPAHNTWTWSYTFGGRLLSASDPDTGTTTYNSYTDNGQPTSVTDGAGTTLAYSYDALDRKTGEYAGSVTGTQLAGWTYDTLPGASVKGQPVAGIRYQGGGQYITQVSGYDARYRPTQTDVIIPSTAPAGLAGTYTSTLHYNPDGSLANQTDPAVGGLPTETRYYRYSDLGNLLAVNAGALSIIARAQYTKLGQLAQYSQGYGAVISRNYVYDQGTDRLSADQTYLGKAGTDVSGDTYLTATNHNYRYDNAGNPTMVSDTVPTNGGTTQVGDDIQCFSLDGLQQLTEAWTEASSAGNCSTTTPTSSAAVAGVSPYWQSYRYDAIGNRTSLTSHATNVTGSTTTTDTYTNYSSPAGGPHQLQSITHSSGAPTSSYTYTAAGNLATAPGQALNYDPEQHLASLTSGGQTQTRLYTAAGDLLTQTSAAGSTLYLGDSQLTVTATNTQAVRTYTALGQPQAQRLATTSGGQTSQALSFLLTSTQGTATTAIDAATGAVTNRYYRPYGDSRTTPTQPNPWPDTGHGYLNAPTDTSTGLTHLGARDYDPALGRFSTVDPVLSPFNPQQNNAYSYAWNNPVTTSDPSGLEPGSWCNTGACTQHLTSSGMNPNGPGNDAGDGSGVSSTPAAPGSHADREGGSDGYHPDPYRDYATPWDYAAGQFSNNHLPFGISSGSWFVPQMGFEAQWNGFFNAYCAALPASCAYYHRVVEPQMANELLGTGLAALGAGLGIRANAARAGAYDASNRLGVPQAADTEAESAAKALSRFPKAAQEAPKPSGFDPKTWQWREASRNIPENHWWDPQGGEWRYHAADKWHDPHFDYNPWTQWNSPWQHIYPDGTGP